MASYSVRTVLVSFTVPASFTEQGSKADRQGGREEGRQEDGELLSLSQKVSKELV